MRTLIIGARSTVTVVSCTSHDVIVGNLQEVTTLKAIPNRELDVLFVVDNSPSMAEEQASLARNFPRMIRRLANARRRTSNLHIGVVTSDMGTSGLQERRRLRRSAAVPEPARASEQRSLCPAPRSRIVSSRTSPMPRRSHRELQRRVA